MAHHPKVVDQRQVTNEYVAYRIVCCGEACDIHTENAKCTREAHVCEDSWHTMSIHIEDHDAKLEERKAEVAARHEKIHKWREKHGK